MPVSKLSPSIHKVLHHLESNQTFDKFGNRVEDGIEVVEMKALRNESKKIFKNQSKKQIGNDIE